MKIAIIGAGASGLFLALKLHNKVDIDIYEANNIIGKKFRMTGNGKCNLSNINMDKKYYNTEFVNNAINCFKPSDLINNLKEYGILTKMDREGRIYPYNESANLLVNYIYDYISDSVNIINKKINSLDELNGYDKIIIATGGISYKGIGSYNLLNESPKILPGLCPIKVNSNDIKGLNGIRVKAKGYLYLDNNYIWNEIGEIQFKEDMLSGIMMFQFSSIMSRNKYTNAYVMIDFFNDIELVDLENIIKNRKMYKLTDALKGLINDKLLLRIIENNNIRNDINADYKKLAHLLKNYKIELKSLDSINNAQVSIGGIDTKNIDDLTMKYKNTNIYVIGEALNVDGLSGGYNLHFAFASAHLCSEDILKCLK